MVVTYVHDMVQEGTPTLRAQFPLSPGYTDKDLKLNILFHLVPKL